MKSPLIHLTSGELIRIITSESYWQNFKPYFLGSKDIIKTKLDEISNVRNALAHFRPIKPGDVELVKQNSLHTLTRIEETICDFLSCSDILPTNTDEEWYHELNTLGTTDVDISFKQSKDEQWVMLFLIFEVPILKKIADPPNHYSFRTANLISDNLLKLYPELTKYIISATESIPIAYTNDPVSERLFKTLNLTFTRDSLQKNFSQIKSEFEKILIKITEEIELIKVDNLARGKLIEVISCYFTKGYGDDLLYYLKSSQFKTQIKESTPEEFWGSSTLYSKNFISETEVFPWMPVKVSEDLELPF